MSNMVSNALRLVAKPDSLAEFPDAFTAVKKRVLQLLFEKENALGAEIGTVAEFEEMLESRLGGAVAPAARHIMEKYKMEAIRWNGRGMVVVFTDSVYTGAYEGRS